VQHCPSELRILEEIFSYVMCIVMQNLHDLRTCVEILQQASCFIFDQRLGGCGSCVGQLDMSVQFCCLNWYGAIFRHGVRRQHNNTTVITQVWKRVLMYK
jgi:hypothetical protein